MKKRILTALLAIAMLTSHGCLRRQGHQHPQQ